MDVTGVSGGAQVTVCTTEELLAAVPPAIYNSHKYLVMSLNYRRYIMKVSPDVA